MDLEKQEGNFYVKNAELLEYGFGYGWLGKHISYPKINFKLRVVQGQGNSSGNSSGNPGHNSNNPGHNPSVNGFSIAKFFNGKI